MDVITTMNDNSLLFERPRCSSVPWCDDSIFGGHGTNWVARALFFGPAKNWVLVRSDDAS